MSTASTATPPVWCNDEALAREKQAFLDYWKPKVEETVGPEDAQMFVVELNRLLETSNANVRHKVEAKAWALYHRVRTALETIKPFFVEDTYSP